MKKPLFKQRKKQLRFLSLHLSKLLRAGNTEDAGLIEKLTLRIRKLLFEMRFALSKHEVKGMLGAVAVVFGLSFSNNAEAQSFGPKQLSPFGIQVSSAYFNAPAMADLDNDGDIDLLTVTDTGAFEFHANTGTATNAQFAAPVAAFNIPMLGYYAFPTFADLDGDGDYDLIASYSDYYTYSTVMNYYENIGTPTTAQFAAPLQNQFGMTPASFGAFPTFADLDADGDMDLMMGEYYGNLQYFENIGTATMPQFTAPVTNPFGLTAGNYIAIPDFADLDEDGDLDLMIGELDPYGNNTLLYFENTGGDTLPQFAPGVNNPYGIVAPAMVAVPAFADIDGDADMDLFVMDYSGGLSYFENTSSIGLKEISSFDFNMYPNPATDIITVETNILVDELIIMDVNGRHITKSSSNIMDVSALNKGLYLLKVINVDGKESIRKFIKL